jgi:hypothetical protein
MKDDGIEVELIGGPHDGNIVFHNPAREDIFYIADFPETETGYQLPVIYHCYHRGESFNKFEYEGVCVREDEE